MSVNRLGEETSPYLLQHKDNPVHWWAWGPAALAEAKRTNKPILLSVGYAACHWCHVMAHESFEDEATAAVMNELFVNIKLDREERPDIDAIYMAALHRLGEHGGWPMTMFLDGDARPFYGGTYYPKRASFGRPGFTTVLRSVAKAYDADPATIDHNASLITAALNRARPKRTFEVTEELLRDLTSRIVRAVDPVYGGLKGAPKFPQWNVFWLLWRGGIRYGDEAAKAAVVNTLTQICQGGIYDHLGGGFARYSVDERWLVPHFEKMLYDNALLLDLLTEVWRETQLPVFEQRIRETVAWLLREMVAEGGGFAASLDADSEGEEGRFYVWTEAEVDEVLGEDAADFKHVYDVTAEGNWEGHTILNRLAEAERATAAAPSSSFPRRREPLQDGETAPLADSDVGSRLRGNDGQRADSEQQLAAMRAKLLARRDGRVRPGWDDKVLADWNGLMIAALARAAVVFDEPAWLAAAERAFAFVETTMTEGGRLRHAHRAGRNTAPATASDYANMTWSALRLYEATLTPRYLEQAVAWTDILDRHYWHEGDDGYATSADDTSDVLVRLRGAADDAVPNANAIHLWNLAALTAVTGKGQYAERAEALLAAFAGDIAEAPAGHAGLLAAAMDRNGIVQVAILGGADGRRGGLAAALHAVSVPGALEFHVGADQAPLASPALVGKSAIDGRPTAYVCAGPTCSAPTTDANGFSTTLASHGRVRRI